MKKFAQISFILCVALMLAAAGIVTLSTEKQTVSYYENRKLARLPEWSEKGVMDGSSFSGLETWLADHAAGRETITMLNTAADLFVLKRPVVNDVVIGDGALTTYIQYNDLNVGYVENTIGYAADNAAQVARTVERYGGEYCFMAVPCQFAFYADAYPEYLNNSGAFVELAREAAAEAMAERDVNYIDVGSIFESLGMQSELSSTVDNHYSAQGAYIAYQAVLEKFNELDPGTFDILTEEDLIFREQPHYYMGSRTRKLFNLLENEEKLFSMEPVVPVPFTRFNNGAEAAAAVYAPPASEDEAISYSYYMGGDWAHTRIETGREELPDVLIYGESFTNPLECILYLSCDTMESIDLRHYTDMTVSEYIELTKPDYVICVRDYSVLNSTTANGGV